MLTLLAGLKLILAFGMPSRPPAPKPPPEKPPTPMPDPDREEAKREEFRDLARKRRAGTTRANTVIGADDGYTLG